MRFRDLAVAMLVIGLGTAAIAPLSTLDGLGLDCLFLLRETVYGPRHAAGSSPTAVVAIDEETYRTPPFADRPLVLWTPELARVLRALLAGEAKMVGLDIILPTSVEKFIPGFDRDFLRTLHQAGDRVLLGKVQHQTLPIHPFAGQSFAVGNARNIRSTNLLAEPDEIVRRTPLLFEAEDAAAGKRRETSFPLELAARAAGVTVAERDGKILFGEREIGGAGPDSMLIDFDGGADVPIYSFGDLFACAEAGKGDFFTSRFAGRVVLIGSVLDLEDRKITSKRFVTGGPAIAADRCMLPSRPDLVRTDLMRESIPGVFIQAAAINAFLRHDFLRELSGPWRLVAIAVPAAMATSLLLLASILWGALALLLLVLLAAIGATIAFHGGWVLPLLPAIAASIACAAAMALYRIAISDRDRRRIREIFGLYVAASVVERLAAGHRMPELGGERRDMSFLFTDVADFTGLSEATDPHLLASLLNRYLEGICAVIMDAGGMVDEIMGDGVLAFFGAPLALPDHAARAVSAAAAIDRFGEIFRAQQLAAGIAFGRTRIGIHSGSALVGNFGSAKRMKYAALGDVVNTASRIEGLNKHFSTRVAVSQTALAGSDPSHFRPLGDVVLKGKSEAIAIFELLQPDELDADFLAGYRAAFVLLRAGDERARALFEALATARPADGPTNFHLARLRAGVISALVRMDEK